jgi:4a-hydroxytetrahydrobiopterin dehydratase
MSDLASKTCVPCRGGVPALTPAEYEPLLTELTNWSVVDDHHLTKTYGFDGFVDPLAFVNRVGAIAEEQGHHPDIYLAWGKVGITIWTHKIDGLTESDFILAAKCDQALSA